jgi:hypothetical protein
VNGLHPASIPRTQSLPPRKSGVEAERESAYLVYRRVYDESWWASRIPRKAADAVVAVGTWAAEGARARDAWGELSEQLQDPYGFDVNAPSRQRAAEPPVEPVA